MIMYIRNPASQKPVANHVQVHPFQTLRPPSTPKKCCMMQCSPPSPLLAPNYYHHYFFLKKPFPNKLFNLFSFSSELITAFLFPSATVCPLPDPTFFSAATGSSTLSV